MPFGLFDCLHTTWFAVAIGSVIWGSSLVPMGMAADNSNPLSLAWEAEPRTIDPRYAQDANSQYLENLIHCALVEYDAGGMLKGWLASAWEWRSPTSLEMTLKKGVTFADGQPLTAKDVRATYLFFKKEGVSPPSPRRGAFTMLQDITLLGEDRLLFQLKEPDAAFLSNLVVGILPQVLAERGALTEKDRVFGCGPFALESMEQGQIRLVPNQFYTLGEKPLVSRAIIKIVKDENTRYAKLKAGELDIVQNLLSRDKVVHLLKKSPDVGIVRRPGLTTTYIGFNMKDPILSRVEVRKAIAHAVDKEKIIKYILNGMATPAEALLPKTSEFYRDKPSENTYDPKLAMELLDRAGFKDPDGIQGREPRFRISLKTTTDLTRISIAKAIAQELKQIGIDVAVESLEWGRFKADVDQGKVQMWTLSWIGFKDPDIYRYAFATESFPPAGGNRGFYSNPALDQLLAKGKAEVALAKRREVYGQVQEILAADLPYVFLWHDEIFAVVRNRVSGFQVYADGRLSALSTVKLTPK